MAADRTKQIVEAYATQQATLTATVLRALLSLWAPFLFWGRPDMVNAWAARSAVDIDIATAQSRRMARAYIVELLRDLDALPPNLPPSIDTYERGGTFTVEVYKRPARQYEHAIRQGKTPLEAAQVFEERLEAIVADDIANTARDEINKVITLAPKVIGYRRLIHPERSKTGTCGLCVVAATRFYTIEELLPLHDECKCTVAPLTAIADPGLKLNQEDLEAIYDAAGSTGAKALKRTRVAIHEHGELGPILRRQGDTFRSVADVNRATTRTTYTPYKRMTRESNAIMWDSMAKSSEHSIRLLLNAKSRGTNMVDLAGLGTPIEVRDVDKAIEYHRSLIARAARHAA